MNVAGWILSIGGYLVGFFFAILFKQSDGDILAVAVEANIPNEGNEFFKVDFISNQLFFSIETIRIENLILFFSTWIDCATDEYSLRYQSTS